MDPETAITNAMYAVEKAGAHPLLTDAIVLLAQAKSKAQQYRDERPLTVGEQAMIDAAWEQHKAAAPSSR